MVGGTKQGFYRILEVEDDGKSGHGTLEGEAVEEGGAGETQERRHEQHEPHQHSHVGHEPPELQGLHRLPQSCDIHLCSNADEITFRGDWG